MIRQLFVAFALGAAAVSPAAASAELITNGSFELFDIPTGTFAVFLSIPGWTTSFGPGLELQDNVAGSPYDGNQHVELDSFANSGMYQDISTATGELYHLSFAYSARPGIASSEIAVSWGGSYLTTLTSNGEPLLDTVWTVYNFDLTAGGSLTRLEFQDVSGAPVTYGGYLDAVSVTIVTPVSEPAALLLLGAGLLGLARLRRGVRV